MRFTGICIVSNQVRRLATFYNELLQLEPHANDTFVSLETPGASLSIYAAEGMEAMAPGSMANAGTGSYTLEFEVADPDLLYRRLQTMGIPIVKPPTTQTWGRRSVWCRDPDGNIINFFTSLPNSQA